MKATETSRRVVIVGGGIAGLSAAVRLAQAGLPVTLLEASQLGSAASTRNQGWLYSGAIYAPEAPDYARACHESLQQTLALCPECVEPHVPPMAFFLSRPDTLAKSWTDAWRACGIPFQPLPIEKLLAELPGLDRLHVQHVFELPDRAIRHEILLAHLAACAQNAGAEIRTETPARAMRREGRHVRAVVTATGEEIAARLVVLAGGASGHALWAEYHQDRAGRQTDTELVTLKTHLLAIDPHIGWRPFCVADADGFNHVPHPPSSIFGTNCWKRAASLEDNLIEADAVSSLCQTIQRFFPQVPLDEPHIHAWSGTIVQAMQLDQIEPGRAMWPTVVDHAQQTPAVDNLLSIFPGRATLWSKLAEETRAVVLNRLDTAPASAALPPWRTR
ncbi:MAG: NAD(P)/FAD-dependent oxidoreductase [Planctomycetaceae bacterium]